MLVPHMSGHRRSAAEGTGFGLFILILPVFGASLPCPRFACVAFNCRVTVSDIQALSVQANTIPDMRVLTEPFAVFSFVFSDPPLEEGRETRLNIEAAQVGTAHAVLCWYVSADVLTPRSYVKCASCDDQQC